MLLWLKWFCKIFDQVYIKVGQTLNNSYKFFKIIAKRLVKLNKIVRKFEKFIGFILKCKTVWINKKFYCALRKI